MSSGENSMNNSTPVISVVIPVYNAEAHLPECLASVRSQTFTQWEAILVDDGSKDGSGRICDQAAEKDPRFSVIHQENGGVSSARNAGIERARGRYLMFIDADDTVVPAYFAEMVNATETYGPDLVLCGFDRFYDDWEKHCQLTPYYAVMFRSPKEFLMVYTESWSNMFGVSIWAKLFRTEIIRQNGLRFDPSISYEEDCVFITEYIPHIRTALGLGALMYRYRQQEESLSKGYRKDTFRFLVNGYRKRCALLKRYGLSEYLTNARSIFLGVVKNNCVKIANAGLGRKERIADYQMMIPIPEVQEAVRPERKPKSGLTKRICNAIKAKNAYRLDRIMRVWRVADALVGFKNELVRRIRDRGKKEEK